MSKIYHYAFSVFDERNEFKVVLRELDYTERNSNQGIIYEVRTPFSKLKLRKCDIGKVHRGKAILLFERNDKKAITIFTEYLNKKIKAAQKIVDDYNRIVGKLQNITVKEEEY